MAVNLQPLADRLVVKPIEAEEKTKTGIYLPDTAKEKPQEGEVVAVGPGRLSDGTDVKIDDEELVILREGDILAKKSK